MEVRLALPPLRGRPTVLRLKEVPPAPVEAGALVPSTFHGRTRDEIKRLTLLVGNREEPLGEYFDVEPGEDGLLRLEGDLSRFKRVAAGLDGGWVHVVGAVGPHAGAGMRSGQLVVEGTAGDWLGAHMEGGKVMVLGDAGHLVGGAYRGYAVGMRGGLILVSGNVGEMAGAGMRRGVIAVGGRAQDFVGYGMRAGTILVWGGSGARAGSLMRRGTIILFARTELLPTFRYDCLVQPLFWPVLRNYLEQEGFLLPQVTVGARFHRFGGDTNELGKGEILLWAGAS